MKIYLKSAGRKAEQEYSWLCIYGGKDEYDLELLSKAERKTTNRGKVAELFMGTGGKVVLFLGNVQTERKDFSLSPIINRIGFVFDSSSEKDKQFASSAVADWYGDCSVIMKTLETGVVESKSEQGFECVPEFVATILSCLSRQGSNILSENGKNLIMQIHDAFAKVESKDTSTKKESKMRISIYTVLSSDNGEFGWYYGGRPSCEKRILSLFGNIGAISRRRTFFALLEHDQDKWTLVVQDIVGMDCLTNRTAPGIIVIELPDAEDDAEHVVRRILIEWLKDNGGRSLNAFKDNVDISGATIKVNEERLHEALNQVGGDASILLDTKQIPARRCTLRLSSDSSNLKQLKTMGAEFISTFDFTHTHGVQFLFTHIAYASSSNSSNQLPSIPARFVVLGYREDEDGDYIDDVALMIEKAKKNNTPIPVISGKSTTSGNHSSPMPHPQNRTIPPPVPWYIRYIVVEVIAIGGAVAALLLWALLKDSGDTNNDKAQPPTNVVTNSVSSFRTETNKTSSVRR